MKRAEDINEKIPWQEMTVGCEIYEPGTSRLTKTGEWRVRTPKWIKEKISGRSAISGKPVSPQ